MSEPVVGWGAVRHDGRRLGARVQEPEGADNYLAELAAQIAAAHAEDEGGRLVLMFDATSPVYAARRFRGRCHRHKQAKYASEWLETLNKLLDRQEIAVMWWQTSHVGAPANEWADEEAERQAREGVTEEVFRARCEMGSMRYSLPKESVVAWATPLARGVVQRKLQAACSNAQSREEYDIPTVTYPDDPPSVARLRYSSSPLVRRRTCAARRQGM